MCVPLEDDSYVQSAHRVGGAFDPEFHKSWRPLCWATYTAVQ